jgi:hypothetical protein
VSNNSQDVMAINGRGPMTPTKGDFALYAGLQGTAPGEGSQFVRRVLPIPSADLRVGDELVFDMFLQTGDNSPAQDVAEVRINNETVAQIRADAGGYDSGWRNHRVIVTSDMIGNPNLRFALFVQKVRTDVPYRVLAGLDGLMVMRPPSLTLELPSTTIRENFLAAMSGTFDYDFDDTFVNITASEGTIQQNDDAKTFLWTNPYLDGPHRSPVDITATDSDGLSRTVQLEVIVNNEPPKIHGDSTSITLNEGSSTSRDFQLTDLGQDTMTLEASIGSLESLGGDAYRWHYTAGNGPSAHLLQLTAWDEDGGESTLDIPIAVDNVPPVVTITGSGEKDSDNPTLSWTATDVVDELAVRMRLEHNGVEVFNGLVDPSGLFSLNDFGVGDFKMTVSANDGAVTVEEMREWTTMDDDTFPPDLTMRGPGQHIHPWDRAKFEWSAGDIESGVSSVQLNVTRNGQVVRSSNEIAGELSLEGLPVGEYEWRIVVEDSDNDRPNDSLSTTVDGRFRITSRVGDFSGDGDIDADDIGMICDAVFNRGTDEWFDLDGNGVVTIEDYNHLIRAILRTTPGDANLDGIFDSRDLVLVFQGGEYEDAIDGNSHWRTGDWNCDGEFTTSDLIAAFQTGAYVEQAPFEVREFTRTMRAGTSSLVATDRADLDLTFTGETPKFFPPIDHDSRGTATVHQQSRIRGTTIAMAGSLLSTSLFDDSADASSSLVTSFSISDPMTYRFSGSISTALIAPIFEGLNEDATASIRLFDTRGSVFSVEDNTTNDVDGPIDLTRLRNATGTLQPGTYQLEILTTAFGGIEGKASAAYDMLFELRPV